MNLNPGVSGLKGYKCKTLSQKEAALTYLEDNQFYFVMFGLVAGIVIT